MNRADQLKHHLMSPVDADEVRILFPDFNDEQAEAWITAYNKAEQYCLLHGAEPEDLATADYDAEKACRMQASRIAREAAWAVRYTSPRQYRMGAFELPQLLADGADPILNDEKLIEGQPVEVLKVGVFTHPNSGTFEITREYLDTLVANAEQFGKRVHFDYDHESESSGSIDPSKAGRAAGWVKEIYRDGDSLWAVPLWTKPAYDAIDAGEWRYVSAAFRGGYVKEGNEEVGDVLTSIAITNQPFLRDMQPIAANDRGEYRWLLMAAEPETGMKIELTAAVLQLLGVSATDNEETVQAALSARLSEHESLTTEKQTFAERIAAAAATIKSMLTHLGAQVPEGLDEATDDALSGAVAAAEKGLTVKLTARGATPPKGMQLVDETELKTLRDGVEAAAQTTKDLREMRFTTAMEQLERNHRVWKDNQRALGRTLYMEQGPEAFEQWAETLVPNEQLKKLTTKSGHGQDPEHQFTDADQETVAKFTELVDKAVKDNGGDRASAMRTVEQGHPELAQRYADLTAPGRRTA